jgi:hypothetical protein
MFMVGLLMKSLRSRLYWWLPAASNFRVITMAAWIQFPRAKQWRLEAANTKPAPLLARPFYGFDFAFVDL